MQLASKRLMRPACTETPLLRKRLVRVHLSREGQEMPGIEGLMRWYRTGWCGGHYTVELAQIIEAVDNGDTRQYTLEGERVRIPRENVAFIQELK